MTTLKVLVGHITPETAYVVDDYPYSFRLRCKIRYWLEHKPTFGYRLVSQTTNPKKAWAEIWNKPKASTYYPLGVMGLDEQGHVTWTGVSLGSNEAQLAAFKQDYESYLDDQGREILARLIQNLERMRARYSTGAGREVRS